MLLAVFTFLIQLACLWSIYKLIWRFNKQKRSFAWIHLMLISIYGVISFGIMFLMALGSTGHYVVSDFEEMMGDVTLYLGFIGILLSFVGSLIAIVKGIRHRKG